MAAGQEQIADLADAMEIFLALLTDAGEEDLELIRQVSSSRDGRYNQDRSIHVPTIILLVRTL